MLNLADKENIAEYVDYDSIEIMFQDRSINSENATAELSKVMVVLSQRPDKVFLMGNHGKDQWWNKVGVDRISIYKPNSFCK